MSQASFEIELVTKTSGRTGTNLSPGELWSPSTVSLKKTLYMRSIALAKICCHQMSFLQKTVAEKLNIIYYVDEFYK